jgi:mono/diheme cytochrome c family protein
VGEAVVSSRGSAGIAKYGFGAVGVALALVAMGGASIAQPKGGSGNLLPTGPAPEATDPAAAQAMLDKGRDLFGNYGCGNCHTLGDAGATGHVGPALDGNANLSPDFIVSRVTNGQGMMPSFSGQMSAEEVNALAAYIMKVKTN